MLTEEGEARAELRERVEEGREFAADVRRVQRRPRSLQLCKLKRQHASGQHPAVLGRHQL